MTTYRPSLWTDREADYAPHTSRSKDYVYWRAPKRCIDLGCSPTRERLPGTIGDGLDRERAARARELTRDMLKQVGLTSIESDPGTWRWLIARYRTDKYSRYHQVKGNTRRSYDWLCDRWERAIGSMKVGDLGYLQVCEIEDRMKQKGRTASYRRRMFTMLRTLASYGALIDAPGADKVQATLSRMRFTMPPRRTQAPTAEQVRQIIEAADARGMHSFACGLLIQWTYMLRAVDVRGQWLPDDGQGGIVRNGTRWQDGLTWDMFDGSLSAFRKVISKTATSMPDAYEFPVTDELRARLRLLGSTGRIGPVIVSERSGLPYTQSGWTQAWGRLRDDLGLPKDLWVMDTRAGAVTDARAHGVDMLALRDAAQHQSSTTTDRYVRDRSTAVANVVKLRTKP